jgi:hypothetical protein
MMSKLNRLAKFRVCRDCTGPGDPGGALPASAMSGDSNPGFPGIVLTNSGDMLRGNVSFKCAKPVTKKDNFNAD